MLKEMGKVVANIFILSNVFLLATGRGGECKTHSDWLPGFGSLESARNLNSALSQLSIIH